MLVAEVLAPDRVSVAGVAHGAVTDKPAALRRLSELLCCGASGMGAHGILTVLSEREQLASTGIGGGVAVPHAALDGLSKQVGALLVCPRPVEFDAIDGEPVAIIFGLIGPRGMPTAHLKVLASVSRLLRNEEFREQLVRARDRDAAYALVTGGERRGS